MGNQQAKNEINNAISDSISVITKNKQNCTTKSKQVIDWVFCGNVEFTGTQIKQKGIFKNGCKQDTSISNDVKSQINNTFTELAENVSQAISANPGDQDSSNIARNCVNLSVTIMNVSTQTCTVDNDQVFKIGVGVQGTPGGGYDCGKDGKGSSTKFTGVLVEQYLDATNKCIQTNKEVNSVKNKITTTIDQSAINKQQGLWIFLAMIILAIVLLFGTTATAGVKALKYIVPLIIVVLGGYFGLAYWQKWWPFQTKEEKKKVERASASKFPNDWNDEEKKNVCGIIDDYLNGNDDTSWPRLRKWVFPDIPNDQSDKTAGKLVKATNKICN